MFHFAYVHRLVFLAFMLYCSTLLLGGKANIIFVNDFLIKTPTMLLGDEYQPFLTSPISLLGVGNSGDLYIFTLHICNSDNNSNNFRRMTQLGA